MTSLEGILAKRKVDILRLQGDPLTFNGEFKGLQITDNQSKHMQKNDIAPDSLDELFVEFGWVRGSTICLLRQSYESGTVLRVKWKLEHPDNSLDARRRALLNPFGALMFAFAADILLEEN